jgi:geranylgeranyl diphosphate synthase type I
MGICFSDVALFAAYDLLGQLPVSPPAYQRLSRLLSREFTHVALAQMRDVYNSYAHQVVTEEEVCKLYQYKTARYTFSVPLMSGALLAEQPDTTVGLFSELGEKLGLIFQIKDDELGLFGTEAETGKPVDSDILEGKKTLYYIRLYQQASLDEKKRLDAIFGHSPLASQDILYVKEQIRSKGIDRQIAAKLDTLAGEAKELIAELQGTKEDYKKYLYRLLDYNLTRKK